MRIILKHQIGWFVTFSAIHAGLWVSGDYLTNQFGGGVLFVTWLPWLPMAWLNIAVIKVGVFVFPTFWGLIWCAMVWLMVYWFLGGALARLTIHASGTPNGAP